MILRLLRDQLPNETKRVILDYLHKIHINSTGTLTKVQVEFIILVYVYQLHH